MSRAEKRQPIEAGIRGAETVIQDASGSRLRVILGGIHEIPLKTLNLAVEVIAPDAVMNLVAESTDSVRVRSRTRRNGIVIHNLIPVRLILQRSEARHLGIG